MGTQRQRQGLGPCLIAGRGAVVRAMPGFPHIRTTCSSACIGELGCPLPVSPVHVRDTPGPRVTPELPFLQGPGSGGEGLLSWLGAPACWDCPACAPLLWTEPAAVSVCAAGGRSSPHGTRHPPRLGSWASLYTICFPCYSLPSFSPTSLSAGSSFHFPQAALPGSPASCSLFQGPRLPFPSRAQGTRRSALSCSAVFQAFCILDRAVYGGHHLEHHCPW